MNQAHADYARQALRATLFLGYALDDTDTLSLEVSEITDRDGPQLLLKECPVQPTDHQTRIEARFYPKEEDGVIGGRIHLYRLRIDGKEHQLPTGGVVAEFDGFAKNGRPELVDALIVA